VFWGGGAKSKESGGLEGRGKKNGRVKTFDSRVPCLTLQKRKGRSKTFQTGKRKKPGGRTY